MGYDQDLAMRVRLLIGDQPVTEKRMFGGLAFLVNGHMAVAASGQGGLLVRVDPDDTESLLARPGASEFQMGNRGPMRGWLGVTGESLADDDILSEWVARGMACARGLPTR